MKGRTCYNSGGVTDGQPLRWSFFVANLNAEKEISAMAPKFWDKQWRKRMAVIVKGEITITKGFNHWKSMVFSQKEKMAGMGMQFLFAGTEKDDPTKLHTIIKFESIEAMQAFGADKELTETRKQAGAVIESGIMTPISDEFFTNYPDAFMQH